MDFASVWVYRYALLGGLIINLIYAAIGTAPGWSSSALLVVGLRTRFAPLRWVLIAYVELFRTRRCSYAVWVHFALPLVTGVNTSTYVSGYDRDRPQRHRLRRRSCARAWTRCPRDSGRRLVRSACQAIQWLRVVLPQAFRAVLPVTNVALGLIRTRRSCPCWRSTADAGRQPIGVEAGRDTHRRGADLLRRRACNLPLRRLVERR